MKISKYITPFVLALVCGYTHAQVASPDLKCLFVQANGDVTLTWVGPSDPNNQFIAYHIFSNTNLGPGFTQVGTVSTYSATTFLHTAAGANSQAIHYYVITEYNNSGNFFSTPIDTLSTIFLNVVNPGTPYGTLNYTALSNPLPSTNSGNYDVYNDFPLSGTFVDNTSALTFIDTVEVCNRMVNYYVENADNTGCVSRSNQNGATFIDNVAPPSVVIDSVSVDGASNDAVMGWQPSTDGGVTAYVIFQWINSAWVAVDTVNGISSTFWTNPNSVADTKSEWYCMAAVDSCGNPGPLSQNQNTIYAQISIDQCLAEATLTWNNYVNWPAGVSSFTVFASYNGGPFISVGSVGPNTFSFVHSGLLNGNYCYYVRANGTSGQTSSSQKLCVTASVAVQPVFTYISTATVVNDLRVDVSAYVDLAASISSYRLERADDPAGPYTVITSVPYSGNPIVTITDNTALTTKQDYYYQVISVDSCGNDAQTSSYSRTVYLRATPNADRTNTLTWNHYEGWLMGTGSYDVYRSIDGGAFNLVGTVNFPGNTFVDDVDPFYESSGHFIYYVEAHEDGVNQFNLQESSLSNQAHCYQQSKFFVPNAFAPSGVNTVFLPLGSYHDKTEYSFSIYNRWGEKLFETTDYTVGWDGTYSGKKCWQGVYVWMVRYKSSIGELIDQSGTVTLLGK